jgi:hypothetical protein
MKRWFGADRRLSGILTSIILLLTLEGSSYALDVTIAWDPNKEPDLAGYLVYYDTGPGVPYSPDIGDYANQYSVDGGKTWNAVTAAPPITVGPDATEIAFKGLADDKDYYFAVKAFDSDNNKSAYSREVSVISPTNISAPYNRGWQITSGDLKGFKVFYNNVTDPGVTPTLGSNDDIPPFNVPGLTGLGIPLNLQPSGTVFAQPLWIEFPCPGYSDINQFSLGLYDGSKWDLAWDGKAGQLTTTGQAWLEGAPQYNTGEYPQTISIIVKHFTGVQAAVPVVTAAAASGGGGGGGGGGCFISTLGGK